MPNLEYRIGAIDVNPDHLRYDGDNPHDAPHKFVVEAIDMVVFIYVAQLHKHRVLAEKFEIPESRRVGGGSYYINNKRRLVLGHFSGEYGSIPCEVAQKFAELLRIKLEAVGIQIYGIVVDTDKVQLNKYWRQRGF